MSTEKLYIQDFVKIALALTLGMSGIISGNSYDFSEVLEFP